MDKGERINIGLLYSYNERWIGGTYYVSNLIHALNTLEDDRKPLISIVSGTRDEYNQLVAMTGYPHTSFIPLFPKYLILERLINKLYGMLKPGQRLIQKEIRFPPVLFPVPLTQEYINVDQKNLPHAVYWIPDLQEKNLPQFFSKEEMDGRTAFQKEVAYKKDYVVFSSFDAQRSFNEFFPHATVRQFVIPFTVTHPDFGRLSGDELLKKYGLPNKYFFSPNQFWIHKNHIVILKTLKRVKDMGIELFIAFSGKEYDHRNPRYFEELKEYVKDNGLEKNVFFLGFIDRAEQLKLMSMSIAVIQPSKSEGWSTVIEDAKAMNKYVIASAIPVHKEQISRNACFFDPENAAELAEELISAWKNKPLVSEYDYAEDVKRFAGNFLDMIDHL
jgi:glycosyltransferase involved in cell wall biosynthesis